MALGQEIIQVFGLLLNRLDDSSHSAGHASLILAGIQVLLLFTLLSVRAFNN
jgi:hypothetical protein